MISITSPDRTRPGRPSKLLRRIAIVAGWLALWHVAALAVGHDLLLVSPVDVLRTLGSLAQTADFWSAVWYSFGRIALGFVLAVAVGSGLAAMAGRWTLLAEILSPVVRAMRSVPVFSFIILVLIWADSSRLSIVISFLMVMPIMYANVLEGVQQIDQHLLEMAQVFRVRPLRRVIAIDVPGVMPYFTAACQVGLGLCWKSGISGEVIGLPTGSIGERLYQAKILLSTADLFAWTLAIVGISFAFERAVLSLLHLANLRLGRALSRR